MYASHPTIDIGFVSEVLVATGINKAEQLGKNAIIAESHAGERDPLPNSGSSIVLSYPNKLEAADALAPYQTEFVSLDRAKVRVHKTIKPNALVACNNIYGLSKALETRAGKATLIYTDPPYGTGMGFQSRSMQHAYDDHRDEATYVEFIRRRLILARELLAEDGSIYVHIGFQMVAELKLVLDEIFGRANFRNIIARRKCSSKNSTRKNYPNLLDFVLFYSKSKNYVWNQPTQEPTAEWLAREYPKRDNKGQYKLVPIHAPGTRNGATGEEWRGMMPPLGKHWQYVPSKLDELDAAGEIHWSKTGNPRRKVYLQADKGLPMTDYWPDFRDAHHQSIAISGYPTEKNLAMVKKIVSASSNPGDLVIDPFCGSGTTMHAADDLGREWIGFDQSLTAIETAAKRLRLGLEPMGDYLNERAPATPELFSKKRRNFELLFDEELVTLYPDDVARISSIHSG